MWAQHPYRLYTTGERARYFARKFVVWFMPVATAQQRVSTRQRYIGGCAQHVSADARGDWPGYRCCWCWGAQRLHPRVETKPRLSLTATHVMLVLKPEQTECRQKPNIHLIKNEWQPKQRTTLEHTRTAQLSRDVTTELFKPLVCCIPWRPQNHARL